MDESKRRAAEKVPLVAEQEQKASGGLKSGAPTSSLNAESGTEPGVGLQPPPHRKSGFMSTSVPYPWLVCGLVLMVSSPLLSAGRLYNCSHPLVPEHGGFRCDPSPCRGFPHKTTIRIFCEPGYHTAIKRPISKCHRGRWLPPIPACVPMKDGPNKKPDSGVNDMPSMATTAVGVSIFLLTTTACLIVKSRLYPCRSHGRRSSDQLDLMVDGLPVPLPSYEEAVYGSWGQRIPPCSAPGPTQLLLSQEAPGYRPPPLGNQPDGSHQPLLSTQSPENPPPPYDEVQPSQPGDRTGDDKDT